jgi:hypothetical protein
MNNNILYNAAYSGAISGITSRWIASEMVGNNSVNLAITAAVAFATMVDDQIDSGTYNSSQAELLASMCEALWNERMPVSIIPNDYLESAQTIKALFEEAAANLQPVSSRLELTSDFSSMPGVEANPYVFNTQDGTCVTFSIRAVVDFAIFGAKAAGAAIGNFFIPELFDGDTKTASGCGGGTIQWATGGGALSWDSYSAGVIGTVVATPGVGTGIIYISGTVQPN